MDYLNGHGDDRQELKDRPSFAGSLRCPFWNAIATPNSRPAPSTIPRHTVGYAWTAHEPFADPFLSRPIYLWTPRAPRWRAWDDRGSAFVSPEYAPATYFSHFYPTMQLMCLGSPQTCDDVMKKVSGAPVRMRGGFGPDRVCGRDLLFMVAGGKARMHNARVPKPRAPMQGIRMSLIESDEGCSWASCGLHGRTPRKDPFSCLSTSA